ncbi:hypothetical protein KUCAC02_016093 [Chaenocephalus aceratus]|uniref:Uncharacterized protein n=1 Tax=Chaenocephalus aceratus TaxID=36190 RepID=A0ACB9Y028_CHAAC|nr:hypothetical protein KUCAC02_016093 [Chaenocephalus aceratus]
MSQVRQTRRPFPQIGEQQRRGPGFSSGVSTLLHQEYVFRARGSDDSDRKPDPACRLSEVLVDISPDKRDACCFHGSVVLQPEV